MKLIFVYGTLKRGFRLSIYWLRYGNYMGEFEISGATLYSIGLPEGDNYPYLVSTGNKEQTVLGELWEIDDNTYRRLVRMECSSGYQRFYMDIDKGRVHFFGIVRPIKYTSHIGKEFKLAMQ